MFNRFTERARRILVLAQQEAVKLQSDHIGTEHLLLGLAGDPESVASKALESLNINLNTMRSQIVEKLSRTPVERQEINYTPRAKKALELAVDEAQNLGHNYVGTEHILLGLIREGEGLAAQILRSLGIDRCHIFVYKENHTAQAFWKRVGWYERVELIMMSRNLE